MRVLSLGAGVQSTALLHLILDGEIAADCAIFADTGWEPRAVYQHLDGLISMCEDHGFPLHVVTAGESIRTVGFRGAKFGAFDLPYFTVNQVGGPGMVRRQCTANFKIRPIRRRVRDLLAAARERHATQLLGISLDEVRRMKPSDVKFITHEFPLIDRGWTRHDCRTYLESKGVTAPRSACIGCPYHSDSEWRRMRDESPGEWADAVAFEREVQAHGLGLHGTPYLHAQRVPLDQVDLSTREDHGQLSFTEECEGMCGV